MSRDYGEGNVLDMPPPGEGLTTRTRPADANKAVGTVAVSLVGDRYLVESGCWFHCATDVGAKPAPRIISVFPPEMGVLLQ